MIQELKEYFSSIEIPNGPIYLHESTRINDVGHFLKSHFKALEENPDSKVNEPIRHRLLKLREILESANG